MKTIQEKAEFARKFITSQTRDNGDRFYCLTDNAPQWMHDLCQDAHEGMFPDDHRYEYIVDALNKLFQYEETDEIQLESDIYSRDLLEWVSSHLGRIEYVNQAMSGCENLISALTAGQWEERHEVLNLVREFLEEREDSDFEVEEVEELEATE